MRNVTYLAHGADLSHPADRRRIRIWAEHFGVDLNLGPPGKNDVLVLNGRQNFDFWLRRHRGPVVIDLVDGYMSYEPTFLEDFSRNVVRCLSGLSQIRHITFSRHLRFALPKASAVIVSSKEQKIDVAKLNTRVYDILDDHSELVTSNSLPQALKRKDTPFTILWEGFGVTLKHLLSQSASIDDYLYESGSRLIVVTEKTFFRWGTRFGRQVASELLSVFFPKSIKQIELRGWSLEDLKKSASEADIAIIPIDMNNKFAVTKPENKLLSFWQLGIPVLCSPIPSYARVVRNCGLEKILVEPNLWHETLWKIFSDNGLEDSLNQAQWYLRLNHSKAVLARKWEEALRPLINA